MDGFVFLAVLFAAVMHAGWNAVIKVGLDRFSCVLLLALVQAAIALPLLPFMTQPHISAWAWIVLSAILHTGYKVFLILAYRHGDLSQIYPIARGSAPFLVAIVSVAMLGEHLSLAGGLAVVAIGLGVILMSMKGGGHLGRMNGYALAFAFGTAGFTASYTLVDGVGARAAGTASGYILWMAVGDAIGMLIYAFAIRGRLALAGLAAAWKTGLAAGAMSLGSYWIAIWAFTQAPLALVAALRETSVLFAMVIAALLLNERPGLWRWTAVGMIATGVVMMRV